jgi:hypothetical protein
MKTPDCLETIGTITIPATASPFVASEGFFRLLAETFCPFLLEKRIETDMYIIGEEFWLEFLRHPCKVEPSFAGSLLRFGEINYKALMKIEESDRDVLQMLGGESFAVTSLTELCFLMTEQLYGNKGVLLIRGSGSWNSFLIRNSAQILRHVTIIFYENDQWSGWEVSVRRVDRNVMVSGGRFFTRNPTTP